MWELLFFFRFIDGEQTPKAIKDKRDRRRITILEKSDDLLYKAERLIYKLDRLHEKIRHVLNS